MSHERLRAKTRGFTYPANAESLAIVRASHGASKASREQLAKVKWKTVEKGEWCDDMPPESAAIYLERGDIEKVLADTHPPTPPPVPKVPSIERRRGQS
jgi:hypothetical protein